MTTEDKDKRGEEEEELTPVGDGVEDQRGAQGSGDSYVDEEARRQAASAAGGDLGDEYEEDEDPDTRLGAAEEGGDEEKRRQRREERQRRKKLRQQSKERDRREIEYLSKRNERLEKQVMDLSQRVGQSEMLTVDQRISQLKSAIKDADGVIKNAIDNSNGSEATEAQGIRDNLRDQLRRLEAYKEQRQSEFSNSEDREEGAKDRGGKNRRSGDEEEQPQLDPRIVSNVRDWHSRNQWFDFGRGDEDSAIAGAIDDMLVREGYDPTTPEYFEELDRRIADRLPHRAQGGEEGDQRQQRQSRGNGRGGGSRRGGPAFRGSGQGGGSHVQVGKGQVYVSRERREAMEEAGVWDDPVLRKKYLKKYAEWDAEHGQGQ